MGYSGGGSMHPRVAAMRSPAKQFTSDLAPGKTVTVGMRDIDRYKRTVAEIVLPNGWNLGQDLCAPGSGRGSGGRRSARRLRFPRTARSPPGLYEEFLEIAYHSRIAFGQRGRYLVVINEGHLGLRIG